MNPIETGNGSIRGVGIRPVTVRVCVQLPDMQGAQHTQGTGDP